MGRPLLVNVLELLRRPGSERELELTVPVAELEIHDERLADSAEIAVELRLESLSDGVVVDGQVRAAFHSECRRCLKPLDGVAVAEVHELYQVDLTDPDAFPIEHDQLDLEPMVREAVLLELPATPLCRSDCAGLCPVCGIDRNVGSCSCDRVVRDERWAALDQLRDQLPEE